MLYRGDLVKFYELNMYTIKKLIKKLPLKKVKYKLIYVCLTIVLAQGLCFLRQR